MSPRTLQAAPLFLRSDSNSSRATLTPLTAATDYHCSIYYHPHTSTSALYPHHLEEKQEQRHRQWQTHRESKALELPTSLLSGTPLVLAMLGLNTLMFLTALDTTIVATTYVPIASEFRSLDQAQWIINSYLITTTAMQPIYGKLSDIIGRVEAIVFAVVLFMIGSVMCAVSTSLWMLIASRAVQGLGGGGLMTLVSVVLGDIIGERERGKWAGLFAGTWGVTSAVAPVIGGAIVKNTTWRIIFWINVPICMVSTAIILRLLKIPRPGGSLREKLLRVDFLGSITSVVGIVLVLLALSWGGQEYHWSSSLVVSCLVIGVALIGVFLFVEWKISREPLMPLRLFRNRNIAISSLSFLFFGASVYGPIMFVPQWALIVKNSSNIESGLYLLPLMIGLVISATMSGLVVEKSGRYREVIWIAAVFLLVGNGLLVRLDQNSGLAMIAIPLFVSGLGFGCANQTLSIVEQANASPRDMAAATTLGLFLRSIGAIIVVAVLSTVMQNSLAPQLADIVRDYPKVVDIVRGVTQNQQVLYSASVPKDVRVLIIDAYMKAMRASFVALLPFTVIFLLIVLGLKHKPLKK
ncbi:hypothetical protein GQ54DRAFT_300011 [Martensiomyces pterosporus]|nr:hypothetical protein GQ54DRAFT_300011 [Martensiomyces pterosporus]